MSARTTDMTTGKPLGLIIRFAIPLMIGNIFQQVYTMVDAIVVGNAIGVHALAALGATQWPVWVIIGMVMGFAQGFAIPVAQDYGRGDFVAIRRTVTEAIKLSGLLTVLITAVSFAIARPLLNLLGTPADILEDALTYAMIVFGGIFAQMAYNLFSSILRSLGNSRTPLLSIIIASVTNIVLDLLFVVGFGWGVVGAAVATVLSQIISALICLAALRRIDFLQFTREDWRRDSGTAGKLMRLGAPLAFQNSIIGVGGFAVQGVANSFGTIFIAGFSAGGKLFGLLTLAATAFGYSMVSYVGQNLGAKQYGRIRTGMRAALIAGIATAAVIGASVLLFGRGIVGLFISDTPEVEARAGEVAYVYVSVLSWGLPVLYLLHIYRSALYGLGDTMIPMISGFVELVMRVAVALTLPALLGEVAVYLTEVAAWIGACALLMATYYIRIRRLPREDVLRA